MCSSVQWRRLGAAWCVARALTRGHPDQDLVNMPVKWGKILHPHLPHLHFHPFHHHHHHDELSPPLPPTNP